MKFNDVSFPHPVLGNNDDVNSIVALNPEPKILSGINSYNITIYCQHDNDELNELINGDKAEYFCEANCSNTLFRKIFTSKTSEINLEIPKRHVKGRINFITALVAKTPILNYQNSKSHSDYRSYSFDLDKGDILAFFGEFNFNADLKYEKLKAVSSFMEVVENMDPNAIYTNVDLNKSKIEVQLPTVDYQKFASDLISKEFKFAPVFHSSIVLNALLIGLYNIDSNKESLWAKVILYRLENEKQFESISIKEKENIPEIAQRLLGNPFSRLISELESTIFEINEMED